MSPIADCTDSIVTSPLVNSVQCVANNADVVSSITVAAKKDTVITPVEGVGNNELVVTSVAPVVNSDPQLSTADLLNVMNEMKKHNEVLIQVNQQYEYIMEQNKKR